MNGFTFNNSTIRILIQKKLGEIEREGEMLAEQADNQLIPEEEFANKYMSCMIQTVALNAMLHLAHKNWTQFHEFVHNFPMYSGEKIAKIFFKITGQYKEEHWEKLQAIHKAFQEIDKNIEERQN